MWQRNDRLLIHITGQCLPHICHPHSFSHVSDQTLTISIFLPRIVSVDMSINGIPANTDQVLGLQEYVEALPQLLIHVDGHTVTQSDEKVHEVPSHPASPVLVAAWHTTRCNAGYALTCLTSVPNHP